MMQVMSGCGKQSLFVMPDFLFFVMKLPPERWVCLFRINKIQTSRGNSMSVEIKCSGVNEEARDIIKGTVKQLIGDGRIHSRDDIIRHLCGANFDITDVTEESITICAPDEPANTLILSGWLFSERFGLDRDKSLSGDGGQLSEGVRSEGSVGS
jgi:hypothetical protein|nr:hypothetical protein [Klebsiella pneumoniae]